MCSNQVIIIPLKLAPHSVSTTVIWLPFPGLPLVSFPWGPHCWRSEENSMLLRVICPQLEMKNVFISNMVWFPIHLVLWSIYDIALLYSCLDVRYDAKGPQWTADCGSIRGSSFSSWNINDGDFLSLILLLII